MIPIALTIAGSDPSGEAGLQADLGVDNGTGVFMRYYPRPIFFPIFNPPSCPHSDCGE